MIPASWATRPLQLFSGAPQVENFRSLGAIFPVRVIRRARTPSPLESGPAFDLPELFSFQGETLQTRRFLDEMETTGLVVLKDGRVVFERYWENLALRDLAVYRVLSTCGEFTLASLRS